MNIYISNCDGLSYMQIEQLLDPSLEQQSSHHCLAYCNWVRQASQALDFSACWRSNAGRREIAIRNSSTVNGQFERFGVSLSVVKDTDQSKSYYLKLISVLKCISWGLNSVCMLCLPRTPGLMLKWTWSQVTKPRVSFAFPSRTTEMR